MFEKKALNRLAKDILVDYPGFEYAPNLHEVVLSIVKNPEYKVDAHTRERLKNHFLVAERVGELFCSRLADEHALSKREKNFLKKVFLTNLHEHYAQDMSEDWLYGSKSRKVIYDVVALAKKSRISCERIVEILSKSEKSLFALLQLTRGDAGSAVKSVFYKPHLLYWHLLREAHYTLKNAVRKS
ncbi:MAG: hypothetical protein ABH803_01490 [Candidatus Micrarchaeota archaeon]